MFEGQNGRLPALIIAKVGNSTPKNTKSENFKLSHSPENMGERWTPAFKKRKEGAHILGEKGRDVAVL